ncbi:diaminopimelate decarboxylase [Streptomyces cinereoruber]|uniref:Diaminopimelate decarboxylase n=1 Tax=Streptomyces cinereoruber TaxID=67260 RepID=A0AAV4KQL8_9ACTN|nr:diaminopimelate decarboxylase [Streptomyces cinereoruber]MBB4161481.1 diaminopimelate decarboxylase [Streptomyces cinereoruber]MBY8818552.1 diaminopimelate decarboxylase [Streptomyces cinereoruber]NIH60777.1 diaminopimelate decarboxylase [Streptomyces cinereoruber]QEV33481.1 diaminopimelate decarboxylase [Streptomyces cinereoruber]GGR44789.1 diaminopimelate decarboxylase [Streptomyces cinereoruber]
MTVESAEFQVQGLRITDLVAEFGTPLYVYDGEALRSRITALRELMHPRLEFFYSLKANPNVSVCALLHAHGARAEVSSMAELLTARKAGVQPRDIIFLGPGKSRAELTECLDQGIHAIICESLPELDLIEEIAAERGVVAPVALRVNPGFAVKGSGLTMGGKPRQFGIDEAQLLAAGPLGKQFDHIRLMGVQAYMGTRILSEDAIVENTRRILETAGRIADHHAFDLDMVDVGGGLGVSYFDGERDLDLGVLAETVNPVLDAFAQSHPKTRLIMELGRYLVAESGTYVTRVRYTKTSLGENFAVADGGTNHHMAAVGIGSFVKRNFPIRLLNRYDEPATEIWNITGPLCTPNDTLGKKVGLPTLREGDLIGVERSGAYGPTASPVNFLSHGYPAEVLIDEGRAHLVRTADSAEDLLAKQHLLDLTPADH